MSSDMTGPEQEEYQARLVVQCRECGKLLAAWGEWEDGGLVACTSGSPIFPPCPSTREHPSCNDKIADGIYLSEQTFKRGEYMVWTNPDMEDLFDSGYAIAEAWMNRDKGGGS